MHEHIQRIVDCQYLEICTPQMAYDWLCKREPPRSVYRNRFSLSNDHEELERILFGRDDPLIDHGLARYGRSQDVAAELYCRLGSAERCVMRACHIAGGGPTEPLEMLTEVSAETMKEMTCWVTNSNLGDGNFESLFNKSDVFSLLDEAQWQGLLTWVGTNPRMATPYKSLYMDGYDEYTYNNVFHQAWMLTTQVPTTQKWAGALERLLQNAVAVSHNLDVTATLERWRIDDKSEDNSKWYSQSQSWYLRANIARLLKPTMALLNSPDMAIRASFYSRFTPVAFPNWTKFVELDGDVFFEYALRNEALWRTENDRMSLSDLAWSMPDPSSNMDAPNNYRAAEHRMRERHPDWFA